MNDISEQRPDFFEGEYLAAADLQQLVIYVRDLAARHALGGHTWGIVAGLQLVEQTTGSSLDVFLLPGYAIDGYGRAIVVVNPLRLTTDLFASASTGPVPVWLSYDQGSTKGTRPGFEVCNVGDSYTRIAESYKLTAGIFSTAQQQAGISVAGETVDDARTAAQLFDDTAPISCDASVPYQDLPLADETSQWLIPLGLVGWTSGVPGTIVALTDEQRLLSRRYRRYLGVVAENVLAADGVIRLRKRTMAVPSGSDATDTTVVDGLCATGDLTDGAYGNALANCGDPAEPTFQELVWVEGRMRVTDDVRILGARLELRDVKNSDYISTDPTIDGSPPTLLQRTDRDTNADLEVIIGKAADGTTNRFLVKQGGDPVAGTDTCDKVSFDPSTTRFCVEDAGNVGIGTESPDQLLEIYGEGDDALVHMHAKGTPSDLYVGAAATGGVIVATGASDIRFRTGGSDPDDDDDTKMTINAAGNVGIGTTDPSSAAQLTLEGAKTAYLCVRTTDPDAHELLAGANSSGALIAANTDDDDLVLAADGNDPKMWIKADGKIGIGTDSPGYDVEVQGGSTTNLSLKASGGPELVLAATSSETYISSKSDDQLAFRINDEQKMVLSTDGWLGIGIDSPDVRLQVDGSIRLGTDGKDWAPRSVEKLRVIAGNINADGSTQNGTSGFSATLKTYGASPYALLYFEVKFDKEFDHEPVVTANFIEMSLASFAAAPQLLAVTSISTTGCNLSIFPLFSYTAVAWQVSFQAVGVID